MANNYFQFKQFTVYQQHCAMKVCTDACILGAYSSGIINGSTANILDIGTGTGLLSLMLAQKTTAGIDAIEMDEAAARQANENVQTSPWAGRIKVIHTAVQQFNSSKKYDLIISNPPFFENDLKSTNEEKNNAKHDTSLTLLELANAINENLSGDGFASILIPYHRTNYFKEISEDAGLYIHEILKVQQSPKHTFFRSIIVLAKQKGNYKEDTLFIHDDQRQYSEGFTVLLKDYYLKL